MSRYHYDAHDMGEREPLDNPNNQYSQPSHDPQYQQYQQYHQQHQPPSQPLREAEAQYSSSPPRNVAALRPGAHPDSAFNRLRADRRYSRDRSMSGSEGRLPAAPYLATGAAAAYAAESLGAQQQGQQQQPQQRDMVSPVSPPQPPAPHGGDGRYWGQQEPGYRAPPPQSNITPGADNFSEAAAGGMAGIAYSVAERNARESGLEALQGAASQSQSPPRRAAQPQQQPQQQQQQQPRPNFPQQAYQAQQHNQPGQGFGQQPVRGRDLNPAYGGGAAYPVDRDSHSSLAGLSAGAIPPSHSSPGMRTPSRSPHSFTNDLYTDDPYQGYSAGQNARLGVVNPNDIEDDGDDGLEYGRRGPRTSMLSLGGGSSHRGHDAAAGAAGAAAAGGVMGALGGLVGRGGGGGSRGPQYGPVHNDSLAYQGDGGRGSVYDLGTPPEKPSEWLSRQNSGAKKWKWAVIIGVGLVVAAGIACGIVFGVVLKNRSSGGGNDGSEGTAAGDTAANGDLNINSPEIQSLLNNPNLHKVFPGIDYTPINTQYPACLTNPPDQNNVTRDVAVLSQLTNTIRLYGTDCNQTEMTIHALTQLQMQDTVKIWMGVWQDNNDTTNARQLAQMYDIFDKYGDKYFVGVIVANEILFREQMTVYQLSTLLDDVRTNLTAKGVNLPVATSDLGNNWTPALAEASDYVMANIHPFFAGVPSTTAASWTWNFWETNNGPVFKSDSSKNIISETGWPSQGGTDCGSDTVTTCPNGSVAGISELNTFMSDWVCAALANGTQYFWFEAFDEPWKIEFDTATQAWEDHWGLMDVNRNLKSGVNIPDCGGKTVSGNS